VNEDPKDAMLREYKEEITKLKKMLAAANGGEIPAEPAAGERFRRRERVTRRNERSA
jgi:kinesin family protein 3/17